MSKASLGAGDIQIELDGETVTLRPTLRAAQAISRMSGGFVATVEALTKFDLDMLTAVIALGLGKEPKDIAEGVWRTGVSNLAPKAITFVTIIANGGRPADGGEGSSDPQPSE